MEGSSQSRDWSANECGTVSEMASGPAADDEKIKCVVDNMSFDSASLKTYGMYGLLFAAVGVAIYLIVRMLRRDKYDEQSEEFLGLFGNGEDYEEDDSDSESDDEEDYTEEEESEDEDEEDYTEEEDDEEVDDGSYDDM